MKIKVRYDEFTENIFRDGNFPKDNVQRNESQNVAGDV